MSVAPLYEASEDEIEELSPELVIRLDPSGRALTVDIRNRQIKLLVRKIGATYIGEDSDSEFLPGDRVVPLLRELNNRGHIFAVENSAGQRLSRTADLRRGILSGRIKPTVAQLEEALLTPPLMNDELERKLFPHQKIAVSWLLREKEAFLGDDMGLGKTLSVLATFDELKRRGIVDFLLVVCPNTLVRNWLRESTQWLPNLWSAQLPKGKGERQSFLAALSGARTELLALNFESFRLADVYPALADFCREHRVMLCVDESQRVKNPRSKSFQALSVVSREAVRRVLLSGTPTPKDITDIWAQMAILDGGKRLGRNYYDWLREVAEVGTRWSRVAIRKFRPDQVAETISKVSTVLLRRRKEDVVDLPPKLFSFRDVELKGAQKERFDEVRKELLLRVSGLNGKSYLKEIETILEEYLRAVQIASNPRIVDESWEGDPVKFLELDAIVDELVRNNQEKLVVWTNYRKNVEELVERYKELGARPFYGEVKEKDRAEYVRDFQSEDGKVRILVAIPAAGGVGITLTAAKTAVYIDRTWNGEQWMQSIDRIHRIGQIGTVNIVVLNGCKIDELIGFSLRRKEKEQANLLGDGKVGMKISYPSKEELLEALKD